MNHTIGYRYIFSFGVNICRAAINFSSGMLLARWLGPDIYGKMAFMTGTFLALISLIDLGSSSAFYTFLSQKVHSRKFISHYFLWMIIQCITPVMVVGFVLPNNWINSIWRGESNALILLSFVAVFFQNSLWSVVSRVGESLRESIKIQTVALMVALCHFFVLMLLWYLDLLTLNMIFIAIILEYGLAAGVAFFGINYTSTVPVENKHEQLKSTLNKYWRYCYTLLPYTIVGFFAQFADTWILQRFGGNIEQAYYAVGMQISAIALIATSSVLHIFWKEIAEANYNNNKEKMRVIYNKTTRILFFIGVFISGLLVPWAADIIQLILGDGFIKGSLTLSILFIYPIHQSLGQINSSMLLATERVSTQVFIGIISMLIGIILTYFVVASPTAIIPGFGLGSIGLAIKGVVLQCVVVNITMFIIAKIWDWPFTWAYQPAGLILCLTLGWTTRILVIYLLGEWCHIVGMMLIYSVLFMVFVFLALMAMPWLIGYTRIQLIEKIPLNFFNLKRRNPSFQ